MKIIYDKLFYNKFEHIESHEEIYSMLSTRI